MKSVVLKYNNDSLNFNFDENTTLHDLQLKILLSFYISPSNFYFLKTDNEKIFLNNDSNEKLIKYNNIKGNEILTIIEIINYKEIFDEEKKQIELNRFKNRTKILFNSKISPQSKINYSGNINFENEMEINNNNNNELLFFKVFRNIFLFNKIYKYIKYSCCGGGGSGGVEDNIQCTHNKSIKFPVFQDDSQYDINYEEEERNNKLFQIFQTDFSNQQQQQQQPNNNNNNNNMNGNYYHKNDYNPIDIKKKFKKFDEIDNVKWMTSRGYLSLLRYKFKLFLKNQNQQRFELYGWDNESLISLIKDCKDLESNENLEIIKYLFKNHFYLFDSKIVESVVLYSNLEVFEYLVLNNFGSIDYCIESVFENCIESIGGGNGNSKAKIIFDMLETLHFNQMDEIEFGESIEICSEFGNFQMVKYLITNKKLINFGYEAIDKASANGYIEIVKYLLQFTNYNFTIDAINNAALNGHIEILKYLFNNHKKKVGDIFLSLANKSTKSIENAILNDHLPIIKFLIFKIFSTSQELLSTGSLFTDCSSRMGRLEILKFFIINCKLPQQQSIELASGAGHLDIIEFLLPKNYKPIHSSAINLASECGHFEIVKLLKKANALSTIYAGEWAAFNGHIEIIKLFNINSSELSNSATNHAASNNQLEIVEYLCKLGFIGTNDSFIQSASNGYLDVLKRLFHYHGNNSLPIDDKTIARICGRNYLSTLSYIYYNRAYCKNPKQSFNQIYTTDAMDKACRFGNLEIVKFIFNNPPLDTGSGSGSGSGSGNGSCCFSTYSLELAASGGFLTIVEFLLKNTQQPSLSRAIKEASRNNRYEVLKYLIQSMKSDQDRIKCIDAINVASENGNLECVRLLNENGFTCTNYAIDNASRNGHLSVVKYLTENTIVSLIDAYDNCAQKNHYQILKYLLENRNEQISNQTLLKSSKNGHFTIIKLLIDTFYLNNNNNNNDEIKKCGQKIMLQFSNKIQQMSTINIVLQNAINIGNNEIVQYLYKSIGLNNLLNFSINLAEIKVLNLEILKFLSKKLLVKFESFAVSELLKKFDDYYLLDFLLSISTDKNIIQESLDKITRISNPSKNSLFYKRKFSSKIN
ncbi:hypothetical protein ACTFIW_003473 [Dictyostelium discoideum]